MSASPGRLVLLGHPVSHSLSPVFQNAALEAADLAVRYEALDVPPSDLEATLKSLRAERAAGNVTVPHKEAVFRMCDSLTAEAKRIGAVNCFAFRDEGLVGHNTDVAGVRAAVTELWGREPHELVFGVIGAGGAAASVLAAVEQWPGCRAIVSNRTPERAAKLVARFPSVARSGDAGEIAGQANIVVNATSLGLRDDDPLPFSPHALAADAAVLDLVYSRQETRLVWEARARGRRAADGVSMLIAQGAAAFEWWFGIRPATELMWRAMNRPRPT